MVAEVCLSYRLQHRVCVAGNGEGDSWMALSQFCFVEVELDDVGAGGKRLPVEAGLLEPEARTERYDDIGLLYQHVRISHAPRVRAAEKVVAFRVNAIRTVPRRHHRDIRRDERSGDAIRDVSRNAATDEENGPFGASDAPEYIFDRSLCSLD
jgi:hypothetical protein